MTNFSKHEVLDIISKFKELLLRQLKTKQVSFNVELKPIKLDFCSCYVILGQNYLNLVITF